MTTPWSAPVRPRMPRLAAIAVIGLGLTISAPAEPNPLRARSSIAEALSTIGGSMRQACLEAYEVPPVVIRFDLVLVLPRRDHRFVGLGL
jgi:hypothetical protein